MSPQSVAEKVVGPVDWIDQFSGFCQCPGIEFHSNPDRTKDCKVQLGVEVDPADAHPPTVFCFHNNCRHIVEDANKALRSELGKLRQGRIISQVRFKIVPKKLGDSKKVIEEKTGWIRDKLLRDHPADIKWFQALEGCKDVDILGPSEGWWQLLTGLYDTNNTIWIGGTYDSGRPKHSNNFRTIGEWIRLESPPGNFICPAVFQPGTFSRCSEAVHSTPYLVVESDELLKEQVLPLFRWLNQFTRIRAIVDSGGKSFHGWFDMPSRERLTELKPILVGLGCDAAMFKDSQPCRIPGVRRGNNFQKLLFLRPRRPKVSIWDTFSNEEKHDYMRTFPG